MADWIEHDGKGVPVHPNIAVDVQLRKGKVRKNIDQIPVESWRHDFGELDIVAYRIHTPNKPKGGD